MWLNWNTHSLRFDRMLISTCAWLRTAVCSSDSGPLLISQASCTSVRQHKPNLGNPSPRSFLPLGLDNVLSGRSHTPYPSPTSRQHLKTVDTEIIGVKCSMLELTCTHCVASGEALCRDGQPNYSGDHRAFGQNSLNIDV